MKRLGILLLVSGCAVAQATADPAKESSYTFLGFGEHGWALVQVTTTRFAMDEDEEDETEPDGCLTVHGRDVGTVSQPVCEEMKAEYTAAKTESPWTLVRHTHPLDSLLVSWERGGKRYPILSREDIDPVDTSFQDPGDVKIPDVSQWKRGHYHALQISYTRADALGNTVPASTFVVVDDRKLVPLAPRCLALRPGDPGAKAGAAPSPEAAKAIERLHAKVGDLFAIQTGPPVAHARPGFQVLYRASYRYTAQAVFEVLRGSVVQDDDDVKLYEKMPCGVTVVYPVAH